MSHIVNCRKLFNSSPSLPLNIDAVGGDCVGSVSGAGSSGNANRPGADFEVGIRNHEDAEARSNFFTLRLCEKLNRQGSKNARVTFDNA